jgi:hypothetical protein
LDNVLLLEMVRNAIEPHPGCQFGRAGGIMAQLFAILACIGKNLLRRDGFPWDIEGDLSRIKEAAAIPPGETQWGNLVAVNAAME